MLEEGRFRDSWGRSELDTWCSQENPGAIATRKEGSPVPPGGTAPRWGPVTETAI